MTSVSAFLNFIQGLFAPKDPQLSDVTLHTLDGETPLRDLTVGDFDLPAFRKDTIFARVFWILSIVFTLTYFWAIVSDIYVLYGLNSNPLIPARIFKAYLAFFFLSLLITIAEVRKASDILKKGDLSETIIDELAYNWFQSRGIEYYGLVSEVQKRYSLVDLILLKVLTMMRQARRMVLLIIPQSIIMLVAILYKYKIIQDSNNVVNTTDPNLVGFVSLIPYIFKFYVLFQDLYKIALLFLAYPIIRCCILMTTKRDMSLRDYLNLNIEKILNVMIQNTDFAAAPQNNDPPAYDHTQQQQQQLLSKKL